MREQEFFPEKEHSQDSDCVLDGTDTCIECGVYHGDPCVKCGGRGFHKTDCPDNDGILAEV